MCTRWRAECSVRGFTWSLEGGREGEGAGSGLAVVSEIESQCLGGAGEGVDCCPSLVRLKGKKRWVLTSC